MATFTLRDHLAGRQETESRLQSGDEKFMRAAIEQARIGERTAGCGAVGCVIVRGDSILSAGCNESELRHDPTAHAEVVTLRKLGALLQVEDFSGCTLYVTLQPCSMCAAACVWARINRIVFGATRALVHPMYFDAKHVNAADLIADAFKEDIEIVGGVLAEQCAGFYYQPDDHPPIEDQNNR